MNGYCRPPNQHMNSDATLALCAKAGCTGYAFLSAGEIKNQATRFDSLGEVALLSTRPEEGPTQIYLRPTHPSEGQLRRR